MANVYDFDATQLSFMASEGIENPSLLWQSDDPIDNVENLKEQIEEVFKKSRW